MTFIYSNKPLDTASNVKAPGCSFALFILVLLVFAAILVALATVVRGT